MHCIHTYALHLSLSLVSLHVHCTYIVHICIASMHFRCRIFLASIDVNCIYAFAMHMHVPCMYPCVLHLCICIASMHVPCIYSHSVCIASVHVSCMSCIHECALHLCMCLASMHVHCMYAGALYLCICIASMHLPCIYAYALHPCMCIAYVHYASPLCICLVCMPIYIHIYIYKAKFIRVDRLRACSVLGVPIKPTRPC